MVKGNSCLFRFSQLEGGRLKIEADGTVPSNNDALPGDLVSRILGDVRGFEMPGNHIKQRAHRPCLRLTYPHIARPDRSAHPVPERAQPAGGRAE